MKKYLLTTLLITISALITQAQEFKLAKTSGKLIINLAAVTVEGNSGNEIIFSTTDVNRDNDERAKGLRPISGSGFMDNTGLGINVTDKGGSVEVNQVNQRRRNITIRVPKGVSVEYTYNKVESGKVTFRNIESEITISAQYNHISLENVTGPLTVNTIYGGIDARLNPNMKGPISIASINGYVDVLIPPGSKANLKLNTSYGEILASADLKIDIEKPVVAEKPDMVKYIGGRDNKIQGKLNGGGTEISLSATHNKIYLRTAERPATEPTATEKSKPENFYFKP